MFLCVPVRVPMYRCMFLCVPICPCVSAHSHITQSPHPDPASVPPSGFSFFELRSCSFDTFLEQFSSGMGRVTANQSHAGTSTEELGSLLTSPSGMVGIPVITDHRAWACAGVTKAGSSSMELGAVSSGAALSLSCLSLPQ